MATRSLTNVDCRLCDCSHLSTHDKPVQHGLSLTPAKVAEYTRKGIPVSITAPQDNQFEASPDRGNFDIDPIYKRGMDQNTLWENAETSRRNILSRRDRLTREQRLEHNKRKSK